MKTSEQLHIFFSFTSTFKLRLVKRLETIAYFQNSLICLI